MIWYLLGITILGLLLLWLVYRAAPSPKKRRGGGRRFAGGLARSKLNPAQSQTIEQRWSEIEGMMQVGRGSSFKQAVVEADKLLDFALRSLGASGETMGDRLQSGESKFSDCQGAWAAHKVRNQLVHEEGYDLQPHDAKHAIAQFRRALVDLGGLS